MTYKNRQHAKLQYLHDMLHHAYHVVCNVTLDTQCDNVVTVVGQSKSITLATVLAWHNF